MTTDDLATPYTILVGIDYSEESVLALSEALALARQRAPSHLHFVQVLADLPSNQVAAGIAAGTQPLAPQVFEPDERVPRAALELRDYVSRILGAPGEHDPKETEHAIAWTTHVRLVPTVQAITQLASDLGANLVVVGTHSRTGLARFLLGSVAEGVVRHAPCPVLVIRPVGSATASDVPQIEPPCSNCVLARRSSGGEQLWCEQHQQHHERRHTYHFSPHKSARQSGLL